MKIVPIVEGFGEVQAVPVLLRRLGQQRTPPVYVDVAKPIRVKRNKIVQPDELERVVDLAGRQTSEEDGILVLLDADLDCPGELGPELLQRAEGSRPDRRIAVVLATKEFEAWLLAGGSSLAGRRGLADNLRSFSDAELIGSPKAVLKNSMTARRSYSETVDQAALTAVLDLPLARSNSASLDKLARDLEALLLL